MDFSDLAAIAGRQRVFRSRHKLEAPGFISHITQRAAGREPLFLEDNDYLYFLSLLKDVSEKFSLSCFCFCLMPNHTHLLLEPAEKNLSAAMHSIFSRYANGFNRKYQRRGHLFGGPYRQAVCLDSSYLLTASVYIHLNPVRAGLTDKATAYRWSSCRLYCRNAPISFVDPGPVLSLIDPQSDTARAHYAEVVDAGREHHPENALEQEGAIESFCTKLARLFPALFEKILNKHRLQSKDKHHDMEWMELEDLLEQYQQQNTTHDPVSLKARKHLAEQLLARGFTKVEVAKHLGVSRQTVYNILWS